MAYSNSTLSFVTCVNVHALPAQAAEHFRYLHVERQLDGELRLADARDPTELCDLPHLYAATQHVVDRLAECDEGSASSPNLRYYVLSSNSRELFAGGLHFPD